MLNAAVVGATGIVGQQLLESLAGHPMIRVSALAASARSAGKTYEDALRDPDTGTLRWYASSDIPQDFASIVVEDAAELDPERFDLIFTAVDSKQARELEPLYAAKVPVLSTASAFRYEPDVPVLIPGVNTAHAGLIRVQQRNRGWKGFIVPGPNCTTTGLVITLKPLYDAFGINAVLVTSMQALSGAGRSPGVGSLDILDNIIPYIPNEEEKVQTETAKILGSLQGDGIVPAPIAVSATCTRVNVSDGHTESVFVSLGRSADLEEVISVWESFQGVPPVSDLPSAPEQLIRVTRDPYRPQPRLDREAGGGMTTTIGRVRRDPVLENGLKYVLLSHNTKMGAAKGVVFIAEMLIRDGYIAARS